MSIADLGAALIVTFGLLDFVLALALVVKPSKPLGRFEYAMIAASVALPFVLWGGQSLGWWEKVGPEWGRNSYALVLAVVSWLLLAALRWRVRA